MVWLPFTALALALATWAAWPQRSQLARALFGPPASAAPVVVAVVQVATI